MRRLEQYKGNFLEASDLASAESVKVKIREIAEPNTVETEDHRKVDKAVMYFEGKKKGLILNKTNFGIMQAMYDTDDIDQWVGKEITLQRRFLLHCIREYNVPCVRIIPPVATPLKLSIWENMGRAEKFTEAEVAAAMHKKANKRRGGA